MVQAIVLWCSIHTGALIANKPMELAEAQTIVEWSKRNPDPDAPFWKLVQEGNDLWDVALSAGDPKNPARYCWTPSV